MNKKTIIIILLALVALTGQAQNIGKDSLYVLGTVADGFTKAAVPDAFVTLMRQDSTVVDTLRVTESHSYTYGVGKGAATTQYYFKMSRQPADYIIKVEHPNYESICTPYSQKRVSRRLQYTHIPTDRQGPPLRGRLSGRGGGKSHKSKNGMEGRHVGI